MKYSTAEAAHNVIYDCLQQFSSLTHSFLKQREDKLLWFRFSDYETQDRTLHHIRTQLIMGTATEENCLFTLVEQALETEINTDMIKDLGNELVYIITELKRIQGSDDSKEYIIVCSDPLEKVNRRYAYWLTANSSQQGSDGKLLKLLQEDNGLQLMLETYRDRCVHGDSMYHSRLTSIVYSELVRDRCRGCGKSCASLHRCSACKSARYCSRNCQREHWKLHRSVCDTEHKIVLAIHGH